MSFWKNLFGNSKKKTQIIPEPEHNLAQKAPDDLMVVKNEDKEKENNQAESNVPEDKKDFLNNKESP